MWASLSGLAVLAHAFGVVRMPLAAGFIGIPAILVLATYVALARPAGHATLLWHVAVGLAAGALATAAYDLSRGALALAGVIDHDPFRAVYVFGELLTGEPATSATARVAGWMYHGWNGLAFALMYALLFSGARWTYGLAWALLLELALLAAYPALLGAPLSAEFVAVSLWGHAWYGAALGLACSRWLAEPGVPVAQA